MAIDLDYIVNLSDEDLAKLTRRQVIYRLKKANEYATERRASMLEFLNDNPQVPKPLIFKKYKNTVKPKGRATDWLNYEFDFNSKDKLGTLKHKLVKARQFLKSKSVTPEGWLGVLDDLTLKLAKETGLTVSLEDLRGRKYKRLWNVYNRIMETRPILAEQMLNPNAVDIKGEKITPSSQIVNLVYTTMVQKDYSSYGVDRLFELLDERLEKMGYINEKKQREEVLTKEENTALKAFESTYEPTGGLGRQG